MVLIPIRSAFTTLSEHHDQPGQHFGNPTDQVEDPLNLALGEVRHRFFRWQAAGAYCRSK